MSRNCQESVKKAILFSRGSQALRRVACSPDVLALYLREASQERKRLEFSGV